MCKVEIGSLFPRYPGRLQVHSLILARYFLKWRQRSTLFWQKTCIFKIGRWMLHCCYVSIRSLERLGILVYSDYSDMEPQVVNFSGRGALTRGWFCSFPRCWKAMGQGASKTCKRGGRPCCWSCCYLGVVCGWALLLGCLNCHPSGLWNHIISPVITHSARVYLKRCPPNNNERGQWRTTRWVSALTVSH